VTESPAWKPTYRVAVGGNGKVMLEGWAIVDNTSGEDWKGVLVGVGSSSALSFKYDLWSVRQVQRDTLHDQEQFAVAHRLEHVRHAATATGAEVWVDRRLARRLFESLVEVSRHATSTDDKHEPFSDDDDSCSLIFAGDPDGIRTRVTCVKGGCPRPLDDGVLCEEFRGVSPDGLEPSTLGLKGRCSTN
jgi:hypothetical protein